MLTDECDMRADCRRPNACSCECARPSAPHAPSSDGGMIAPGAGNKLVPVDYDYCFYLTSLLVMETSPQSDSRVAPSAEPHPVGRSVGAWTEQLEPPLPRKL